MPRIARSIQNVQLFHVLVEGNDGEKIFPNKEFKEIYLQLVIKHAVENDVHLLGYVIFDTHAHLVIYSETINGLSDFMSLNNKVYARKFNSLTGRSGSLFKGRFKSQPLSDGAALSACLNYIQTEPVALEIVKTSVEYEYSSVGVFHKDNGVIDIQLRDKLIADVSGAPVPTEWLECSSTATEAFAVVFKEIMRRYRITSPAMLMANEDLVVGIVCELKERCGLSIRQLAVFLGVGRETLRKAIVKHQAQVR